jgi:hypothetical protein
MPCVFKSVYSTVKRIFHFSYFDPDCPTPGLTVTGLARVCMLLTVESIVMNCKDETGMRTQNARAQRGLNGLHLRPDAVYWRLS